MKIICFTSRFHTNLYYRMKALVDAGHEVEVAVLYKGVSEYSKNIRVTELGLSGATILFEKILRKFKKSYLKSDLELMLQRPDKKKLKQLLDRFTPDLVLVKSYQDMFSETILKMAKKRGISSLILTQTKKNHLKGSVGLLKMYLERLTKLGVAGFLTPIKINEENFQHIGVSNVHYLPFVYPAVDFHKEYFKNQNINILSIGKFVPRKGQMILLKALKMLEEKYPHLTVTLLGENADEGYINELKDFVKTGKLEDRVSFLYNLPYEKTLETYKEYDLYILPSHNEPAAYSIVEAMANKLPVICSDDNGTCCYIREGENGYIFQKKNPADLADKIDSIVSDKERLVKFGKKSYELALTEHMPKRFSDFFKTIERAKYS